jgi:hypothetical protein
MVFFIPLLHGIRIQAVDGRIQWISLSVIQLLRFEEGRLKSIV